MYSDYKYYHWMVSASMYEMIRKDLNRDTAKIINGVQTIDIGSVKLKKVDLFTWKSYTSENN